MKKVYRLMVALLCVPLIFGAVLGCEKKNQANQETKQESKSIDYNMNNAGFPIMKEKTTLNGLAAKQPTQMDWNQMWFWQEYEKMTNIHVEWELAEDSTFVEKRNIKIASGNLPDIIFRAKLTPDDEYNYGKNGIIVSLDKYINDFAPNLKDLLTKYPDLKKAIAMTDGKVYSTPQVKIADYAGKIAGSTNGKLYLRKDWMDKLKLSTPKTVDEYYTTLKAFKEKDPNGNSKADEIPLIASKPDGTDGAGGIFAFISALKGYWGLGTRGQNNDGYIDIDEKGKLRFIPTSDRFKEVLQFVNKLYKEGLLDKESFSQDVVQVKAKAKKGLVGSFFSGNPTNVYTVTDEEIGANIMQVPVLSGPYGKGIFSNVSPILETGGTFVITKSNKYPEASMRWVDYFYGKEGSKMLRFGQEGVHSQSSPEYKWIIPKDDYGKYLVRAGGWLPVLVDAESDENYQSTNVKNLTIAARALYGQDIPTKIWSDFSYIPEEAKIRQTAFKDIDTYISEKAASYIAEGNFSDWEDYKSKLDKMGLKDLMKVYQLALDRAGYEK